MYLIFSRRATSFSRYLSGLATVLVLCGFVANDVKAQITETYNYTGAVQTFTVPACVSQITITAKGAKGSNGTISPARPTTSVGQGALGGLVVGTYTVTPGEVYHIFVGGAAHDSVGGFNGGGNGATFSGAGGGASDVRKGDTAINSRVFVAGGGGGGGNNGDYTVLPIGGNGGLGGGGNGSDGQDWTVGTGGGKGGAGSVGGAVGGGCSFAAGTPGANGTARSGGKGGRGYIWLGSPSSNVLISGGGGGGGYVGGGGGGAATYGTYSCTTNYGGAAGGGAGGSSYADDGFTDLTFTPGGGDNGDGSIVITYTLNATPTVSASTVPSVIQGNTSVNLPYTATGTPNTYTLDFDATANTAGFVDVTVPTSLGSSFVTLSVPAGAPVGTYHGNITVSNNGCASTPVAFSLTVDPANITPVFLSASPSALTLCRNAAAVNLKPYLHASDADIEQTLTWTQQAAPAHGTLVITGATASSESTDITPGGTVTYQPTTGYAGADTFTIRVSDGIGFSDMMFNVDVDNITATITPTAVSCNGGSNGAATATATGGLAPFTYAWSNGSITQTITGLIPTTYQAWITDANGCEATDTAIVAQPAVLDATITPTAVSCNGGSNGSAVVSATGGTAPYFYSWLPAGGTSATATGLTAGTYSVTITDNNSCTATFGTTVSEPAALTASISGTDTICIGSATTITITAGANNMVGYTVNSGSVIYAELDGTGVADISTGVLSIPAVYQLVNVSDGTCTTAATGSANIDLYALPVVDPVTNVVVCNGLATSDIAFSGAATDAVYSWTNNNAGIGLAASGTGNIAGFTGVNNDVVPVVATVSVVATENGCTGNPTTFTIRVNPTPVVDPVADVVVCNGASVSVSFGGAMPGFAGFAAGPEYAWVNNDASIGLAASGTGDIASFTAVNTGVAPVVATVVVTPTELGCIGAADTFQITVNPTPALSTTLTPSAVCDSALFSYIPASLTTGTTFSWTRDTMDNILNASATGTGDPAEYLVNVAPYPVNVAYVYTLTANGCNNVQTVQMTANPKPLLSTTLTPASVCDSATFSYMPASATSSAAFNWSRAAVAGIANVAATGTNDPAEILYNTTADSVAVDYVYTLTAYGCSNTQVVQVYVRPTPKLSTTLTPAAICNSTVFSYVPASATGGTSFNWSRAAVSGISNPAASGAGDPMETLLNTDIAPVNVNYVYNLAATGCANQQVVTVRVNPTPKLNSSTLADVCSTAPFNYVPTSATTGTTYAWTRAAAAGISNVAGSGTGNIAEVLLNTTNTAKTVIYRYTLTANGCSNVQNVLVTVDPAPAAPSIAIHPAASLCSNSMYMNFGASQSAPDSVNYAWSAQNAVVYAQGTGNRNSVVSFPAAGTANVILTARVGAYTCYARDTFTVAVGTGAAPNAEVYYVSDHFIYTDNSVDSYQWGFDDAATLDSTMYTGQVDQNMYIPTPDFAGKKYWVITTKGGCLSKSYYNAPVGVAQVNAAEAVSMNMFPNPASNNVFVEVNGANGNGTVELVDLSGKVISRVALQNSKAVVNVSDLASGMYMVTCSVDGVKVTTAKLVKQ